MLPLKEATRDKHKQAERMPFNTRMVKGLLTKKEYFIYLNQQMQVFSTIENKGLPHRGLGRVDKVKEDMDELESQGAYSGLILPGTKAYVDYLDSLSYGEVLPHVYLNYLALMFGGQMMKHAVPSKGRMYVFEDMNESMQSIRDLQKDEWAGEVNKGFEYHIAIFEELEAVCSKEQMNYKD